MQGHIKFSYAGSPLFRRLFCSTFAAVILVITLISLTNLFVTQGFIRQQREFINQSLINQISLNIAGRLKQTEKSFFSSFAHSPLNHPKEHNRRVDIQFQLETIQALKNILYSADYIRTVTFCDDHNEIYQVMKDEMSPDISDSSRVLGRDSIGYARPEWFFLDGDTVILQQSLFDTSSLTYLGVLKAVVDIDHFTASFDSIKTDLKSDIVLCDSQGNPLILNGTDDLYSSENRDQSIRAEAVIPGYPLKLQLTTSTRIAFAGINSMQSMAAVAGCLAILVIGFLNYKTARRYSWNVARMVDTIKDFGNDTLSLPDLLETGDEIETLSHEIRDMAQRIQDLVARIGENERRSKEAERQAIMARLSALKAQTNPHFIYNVLEAINSIARTEEIEVISRITVLLGTLIRESVRRVENFVPLGKELILVESLVNIHQIVYEYPFQYKTEIETGLEECLLPSFILMPLVENAIVHGVQKCLKKDGIIIVKARRDGDFLEVSVSDNGPHPLKEEDLEKLPAEEKSLDKGLREWERTKLGLKSVNERLSILYHGNLKMQIIPGEDRGSCVLIRIPANPGKKDGL